MPPQPTIISTHQHRSDGPTEADKEDGSEEDNTSEDEGNEEDNDEGNDSKQDCMFLFFSWHFFISYFTFLLGSSGMWFFFFGTGFLKIIFSGPAGM